MDFEQSFGPLRKHLKNMMRIVIHYSKNFSYEFQWNVFMKQIAHGIHEDNSSMLPGVRNAQLIFMNSHAKAIRVFLYTHCLQSPRHNFCITEFTSCGYFGTTCCGIPGH